MSSPFLSAEPMEFVSDAAKLQQQEEMQRQIAEQQPTSDPIKQFRDQCIDAMTLPYDWNKIWEFILNYLTYLENQQGYIVPVLHVYYPETKDERNLMRILYLAAGNSDDVSDIFGVLVSVGNDIARKHERDNQDNYYLRHVVLNVDDNSPINAFRDLLDSEDSAGTDTYRALNDKFKNSMKTYIVDINDYKKSQLTEYLERKVSVPGISKQVSVKIIIIIIVCVLFVIIAAGFAYHYWFSGSASSSSNSDMDDFLPRRYSSASTESSGSHGMLE